MNPGPCPSCGAPLRTAYRYSVGYGRNLVHLICSRCAFEHTFARMPTIYERVSSSVSFYDMCASSADMPRCSPDEKVCVFCGHPWTKHLGIQDGGCACTVPVRVDIDAWGDHRCGCLRKPSS